MKNEKIELIEHISEQLKVHEEAYETGAWESFVQFEKNKRPKLVHLRRFAAAASILLLLALGAFLYFSNSLSVLNNNANSKIVLTPSLLGNKNRHTNVNANDNLLKQKKLINKSSVKLQLSNDNSTTNFSKGNTLTYVKKDILIDTFRQVNNHLPNYSLHKDTSNKLMIAKEKQKPKLPKIWMPYNSQEDKQRKDLYLGQMAFDNNQDVINNGDTKKWSLGVVVTPSVGNNSKLNMGYGVAVGYKLTKKLSLNSGLAYTELSGSKDVANNTVVAGSRSLESIEADVTGINLPIEISYHFNSNLYASAGVSAMAVLSNSQQNHYAVNQYQTSSFAANNGNLLKTQSLVNSADTKAVEEVPSSQLNNQNFAGFLNFSFGYKQKISNKMKSISVEPFISIPMSNNLANQNIHLGEMGVRFRVGL